MIDSTLFIYFFVFLALSRNRCLRNVVIQTHYTIIPKSTLLQNRWSHPGWLCVQPDPGFEILCRSIKRKCFLFL